MNIITLTTDWKRNDYYLGAMKGYILSACPKAVIVDISHEVQPFNILQAAFILKNSFRNFPAGTVHLLCVNSESPENPSCLLIQYEDHFFIGADNGIFGLIFDRTPEKIIEITGNSTPSTFPELTQFAPAACKLLNGICIDEMGGQKTELSRRTALMPAIEDNVISGNVVYIDSYRNAITNIDTVLFEKIGKNKPFEILINNNLYKITKINRYYNETQDGEMLAVFNHAGLLEIAVKDGNASELLGLDIMSNIRIKFYDHTNS